jgi:hypothetical protein
MCATALCAVRVRRGWSAWTSMRARRSISGPLVVQVIQVHHGPRAPSSGAEHQAQEHAAGVIGGVDDHGEAGARRGVESLGRAA